MNFGKPKRITEIRSGCVGHLHPPRRKSFGKTKDEYKENPSMNEKDGMESILRTKAPKGEGARVQLRSIAAAATNQCTIVRSTARAQ
jgi:hypothetical protein